jgi:hypothetical protein
MGRPSKYNEEMLERAKQYIEIHKELGDEVPSIEGFAYYAGVGRKNLYNWAEENEAFLHTLEDIKSKQAKMLISGGLNGEYNASIAKLMLYNHGYSEKQDMNLNAEVHGKIDTEFNIVEPNGDS